MPTNAINDTGVKYLYDKLHGEIEPVAEAVSTDEVIIEGNPLSFNTLSSQNAKSTILSVEPIQDLHGYDKPWVGGAGKNIIPMTVANLKSLNTSGTWNDLEYTISTLKITILLDNANNIIGLKANGTPTARVNFVLCDRTTLPDTLPTGRYTLSGSVSGSSATIWLTNHGVQSSEMSTNGSEGNLTYTTESNTKITLTFTESETVNNLTFLPMFRKQTEPSGFAPYENECPITGRTEIGILGCGVNIANPAYYKDGYVLASDGSENANANYCITKASVVFANEVYSVKFERNNPSGIDPLRIGIYDLNMNFISRPTIGGTSGTVTMPTNARYIRLSYEKADLYNIQVEKGNQSTQYTAYQSSNDLTISFGQTVYGGTIDVENGVFVVNKVCNDMGDLSWNYNSSYDFFNTVANTLPDGLYPNQFYLSSAYEAIGAISNANMVNVATGSMGCGAGNAGIMFKVKDTRYTDAQTFTTAVTGQKICYKLATPITINLTPNVISLLEGVNNISTTADGIKLTYRNGSVATLGDVKALGDNLTQEIADSQILTDTVTGDKYKLVVTSGVLSIEQISN